MSDRFLHGAAAIVLALASCGLIGETRAQQAQPPGGGAADLLDDQAELGSVNGEPIRAGEIRQLYSQFSIPPQNRADAYPDIVDVLVGNRLLLQYVKEQSGVSVPESQVEDQIEQLKTSLESQGTDLYAEIAKANQSPEDLKERIREDLLLQTFVSQQATEARLKQFVQANEDIFDGTLVQASHILVKVPPEASTEQVEDLRKRLANLKRLIEAGEISFAEAANKYSQDEGNIATQNGGDLGKFPRRGRYVDEFADIAFSLPVGEISDPVRTEFGWHLIQVTDREPGEMPEFSQIQPAAQNLFVQDLIGQIVDRQREQARVEVKPMPENLFPPVADAASAPAVEGSDLGDGRD